MSLLILGFFTEKHPDIANQLNRIGMAVVNGNIREAERRLDEISRLAKQELPPGDPYWLLLGDVFYEVARFQYEDLKVTRVDAWLRESLAIRRRELPAQHPQIALTMGMLVDILGELRRYSEIEQLADESATIFLQSLPETHWRVVGTRVWLARSALGRMEYTKAEELLASALPVLRAAGARSSTEKAMTLRAELYEEWGKENQARQARDALANYCIQSGNLPSHATVRAAFGPEHAAILKALDLLRPKSVGGIPEGDVASHLAALEERVDALNPAHPLRALAAKHLMDWCSPRKMPDAEPGRSMSALARDLLDGCSRSLPADRSLARQYLARFEIRGGQLAQAEEHAQQAFDLLRGVPGESWERAECHRVLGEALRRQHRYQEAEPCIVDSYAAAVEQRGRLLTMGQYRSVVNLYQDWEKPDRARPYTESLLHAFRAATDRPGAPPITLNDHAWLLLTCLPLDLRDPAHALVLIRRAVERSGGRTAQTLDTLSVALDQTGDRPAAIEAAREALELVTPARPRLRAEIEKRLARWQAGH